MRFSREALKKLGLMPVPRCQTCRWWDQRRLAEERARAAVALNVKVKAPERSGECTLAYEEDSPVSIYGEGWDDRMVTAPDFGCVQWEAKRDE